MIISYKRYAEELERALTDDALQQDQAGLRQVCAGVVASVDSFVQVFGRAVLSALLSLRSVPSPFPWVPAGAMPGSCQGRMGMSQVVVPHIPSE